MCQQKCVCVCVCWGCLCEITGGILTSSVIFLSVTDALRVQQKLDETTRLLHDLQEAQKERLSTKQPSNMICLLAPTEKELELGKSLPRMRSSRVLYTSLQSPKTLKPIRHT